MADKAELERLIRQEKTIGHYVFDERKQCFLSDVEIVLYLIKIAEKRYRTDCYYFDDHEVALQNEQQTIYSGDEASVKQAALADFHGHSDQFMNYPIVYTHVEYECLAE